jgi:hypothetical protein
MFFTIHAWGKFYNLPWKRKSKVEVSYMNISGDEGRKKSEKNFSNKRCVREN